MKTTFPSADILVKRWPLISAIGSQRADTWVLPTMLNALANASVEILRLHKYMRQLDIQFMMSAENFPKAASALQTNLSEESR